MARRGAASAARGRQSQMQSPMNEKRDLFARLQSRNVALRDAAREELAAAVARHEGDLRAAADELKVSARTVRKHLTEKPVLAHHPRAHLQLVGGGAQVALVAGDRRRELLPRGGALGDVAALETGEQISLLGHG